MVNIDDILVLTWFLLILDNGRYMLDSLELIFPSID
jgi:hypothetical protein